MIEQSVEFWSEGVKLSALWRAPAGTAGGAVPAVIQGPGWLGLKDAALYVRYHQAFTEAGYGVLVLDYRGFGDSEGSRGTLSLTGQLEDLVNGVTYLTTRPDVDRDSIAVFGSGGTGGGNAVLIAACDPRIKCAIAQVPVGDGAEWLRRMRSDQEWAMFLASLEEDRRSRVLSGVGATVDPRRQIMIPTQERRTTSIKADVDDRVPRSVALRGAETILAYRPIDVVHRIAPRPLMIVAVDGDDVTPTDQAVALYERAGVPKRLVLQHDTTHYAAYDRYWDAVTPMMIQWLNTAFGRHDVASETASVPGVEVLEALLGPKDGGR